MRTYQVRMKDGNPSVVKIVADDVNLDTIGDDGARAFWNFTTHDDDGDDITMAAIPFSEVAYITSEA